MTRYTAKTKRRYPSPGCHLGISVGSDYHDGERLRAQVAWARANYAHVHICVGDTLQRHNRMLLTQERPEDALRSSRSEGDAWLHRNRTVFEALGHSYSVSRWDDWLADPRYPPARAAVEAIYAASSELRDAVARDTARFIARQAARCTNRTMAEARCRDFLLEENAVFPLLVEDCFEVMAYPGTELESTKCLQSMTLPAAIVAIRRRKYVRLWIAAEEGAA